MGERILPGIKKLAEAEKIARKQARPEPIFSDPRQLKPRLIMPSAEEITELKRAYGIRYLGDQRQK